MPIVKQQSIKSYIRNTLILIGVSFGAGYVTGRSAFDPEAARVRDAALHYVNRRIDYLHDDAEKEYEAVLEAIKTVLEGTEPPISGSLEDRARMQE